MSRTLALGLTVYLLGAVISLQGGISREHRKSGAKRVLVMRASTPPPVQVIDVVDGAPASIMIEALRLRPTERVAAADEHPFPYGMDLATYLELTGRAGDRRARYLDLTIRDTRTARDRRALVLVH